MPLSVSTAAGFMSYSRYAATQEHGILSTTILAFEIVKSYRKSSFSARIHFELGSDYWIKLTRITSIELNVCVHLICFH